MRIGIDAHILSPEHHRHHPEIANYTDRLLKSLLAKDQENSYVLFMDSRTPLAKVAEHKKPNVEIKRFPFTQYRAYLPFLYSHMLVSSILSAAKLDVFHSPEGLIPYLYPGRIVATFHWVPTGKKESNIFLKTWMLGARTGFAAFCRKADRIILRKERDRDILCEVHGYPKERAYVVPSQDCNAVDWNAHANEILAIYNGARAEKKKKKKGKEGNIRTQVSRMKKFSPRL